MSDFETHPAGTAARLAELEAGRVNPSAVAGLVEAAQAVCEWDWSYLGLMPNDCDWVPALDDIERLERALVALDKKESSE